MDADTKEIRERIMEHARTLKPEGIDADDGRIPGETHFEIPGCLACGTREVTLPLLDDEFFRHGGWEPVISWEIGGVPEDVLEALAAGLDLDGLGAGIDGDAVFGRAGECFFRDFMDGLSDAIRACGSGWHAVVETRMGPMTATGYLECWESGDAAYLVGPEGFEKLAPRNGENPLEMTMRAIIGACGAERAAQAYTDYFEEMIKKG